MHRITSIRDDVLLRLATLGDQQISVKLSELVRWGLVTLVLLYALYMSMDWRAVETRQMPLCGTPTDSQTVTCNYHIEYRDRTVDYTAIVTNR